MLLGLVLVVGAVVLLIQQRDTVTEAWAAVRQPDPFCLVLLLGGVVMNVVFSGLMFNLLLSRYGRVGILEMQALIAAATLVNYLPLRPGLIWRIAYHKAVNRILAVHSAKTLVQASILSVAMVVYLAAVMATAAAFGSSRAVMMWGIALPVPFLIVGLAYKSIRLWVAASLVRYAEVLVWAGRYYAAFNLIGCAVEPQEALVFACISMLATMLPLVSNGLGLREWSIGAAYPMLSTGRIEQGIAAELVNRAAEVAVVAVLGLAGLIYLAIVRRSAIRASRRSQSADKCD